MIKQIMTSVVAFEKDIADGEVFGITDDELDAEIAKIFDEEDEAPIEFVARKSNPIDMAIQGVIDEHDLRVPIVHIKGKMYLIGSLRDTVDFDSTTGELMVNHSGAMHNFEDFIVDTQKTLQRMLVFEMIKTEQSLEEVVDNLVAGGARTFAKKTKITSKANWFSGSLR